MDKITRLLLLYSKLTHGEKINKLNFCMETNSFPRSFDRDIEDIRMYLSEMFYNEELIYNRYENVYYIEGLQRKALETMEYLFVERVLIDTGILRMDEMDGLLTNLSMTTESRSKMIFRKNECIMEYNEPLHNKALLKMHGDLATIINNNSVIKLSYIKMNGELVEREVVPCTIKYDLGYLYLIAFYQSSNSKYPAYFRMDRIYSFCIVRDKRSAELKRVAEYMEKHSQGITQMFGGQFVEILLSCKKEFYPYVHDKFRKAIVVKEVDDFLNVKISVFEDGFVKWIISQPAELVYIVGPQEIKQKIINKANELVKIYMEGVYNGEKN